MKRKFFVIILLMLVSVAVFVAIKAGEEKTSYQSFQGSIFGTRYQVQYHAHEQLGMEAAAMQAQVEKRLQRIDQIASTWKADSEISRYNRAVSKDDFSSRMN